jgi:hypothetical protein
MSQYRIYTKSGRSIKADDVRSKEGGMVEYIEPYTHETKRVWGGDVKSIEESNENILGPIGKIFEPKFPK